MIKKYKLALRLFEIEIMLQEKYGIVETISTHVIGGTGGGPTEAYPIPQDMLYMQSTKLKYEKLKKQFEEEDYEKDTVDYFLFLLLFPKNNAISDLTEEFWIIVNQEGLDVKRKNNRLLNILRKGYFSNLEDKDAFFPCIKQLINSDVFYKVYNEDIKLQIEKIIESTKLKMLEKADKLMSKKSLNFYDRYKLWEINNEFERYDEVLVIPSDRHLKIKQFVDQFEDF